MAEYISAEVLEKFIHDFHGNMPGSFKSELLWAIDKLPRADVVERKTGKWIYPSDITGFGRCSECKALWDYSLITNKFFNVCPRCGSYNGGDDDA